MLIRNVSAKQIGEKTNYFLVRSNYSINYDWLWFDGHGNKLCFKYLTSRYSGLEVMLIDTLAASANFSYKYKAPADGEWGQRFANGTWTGMIGELKYGVMLCWVNKEGNRHAMAKNYVPKLLKLENNLKYILNYILLIDNIIDLITHNMSIVQWNRLLYCESNESAASKVS